MPADRDPQPVRPCGTCTPDLYALAAWLATCPIETVAMEATGVYGMPVSALLEARGVQAHLVHARHLTHVPGRKTDAKECQRIQHRHTGGRLRGSCRPEAARCAVRADLRHRATLRAYRAAPIQHMQKALQQLHVPLTHVRSALTGTTGLTSIRAIVARARDPVQLARFRDRRCQSSREEIATAVTGHYRPEQVFALQPALARYDTYTVQVRACAAASERQFPALTPVWPDPPAPWDREAKRDSHRTHAPAYDARRWL